MFLHLSVSDFVHSGSVCIPACTGADTPLLGRYPRVSQHALGQTPRRPLQRTVRILLECILVLFVFAVLNKNVSAMISSFLPLSLEQNEK